MRHYTDPRLADTARAVAALPSIEPAKVQAQALLKATGTNGAAAIADDCSEENNRSNSCVQHGAQQLCGSHRQRGATSGDGNQPATQTPKRSVNRVLTRQNPTIDNICHSVAGCDLMPGADGANIRNSRAVGAVG